MTKKLTTDLLEEARQLGNEIAENLWRKLVQGDEEEKVYDPDNLVIVAESDCKMWTKVRKLEHVDDIVFVACLMRLRELTVDKIYKISSIK